MSINYTSPSINEVTLNVKTKDFEPLVSSQSLLFAKSKNATEFSSEWSGLYLLQLGENWIPVFLQKGDSSNLFNILSIHQHIVDQICIKNHRLERIYPILRIEYTY